MEKKVTLRDIARLAGVSQSTVSKALNDRFDVNPRTRAKILKIAQKNNFIPNAVGKALKHQRTNNVGVIFHRDDNPLRNPFFSRVLEGIEAELALNQYNLVLYLMPESKTAALPKMVLEGKIDGVILVGNKNRQMVQQLLESNFPVVLIDPRHSLSHCSQVLIDNENGAFLATQHLILNGHRQIGFISGDLTIFSFKKRLQGYQKALKYYNIPVRDDLIQAGGFEAGYQQTKILLDLADRPTAIFSVYDVNALGAYKAIHEANLRIPDDISIVGFDDIGVAKMANPPLTTIRVYKEELGSVAVRNLREMVNEGSNLPTTTIIPVRLVERDSVKSLDNTFRQSISNDEVV